MAPFLFIPCIDVFIVFTGRFLWPKIMKTYQVRPSMLLHNEKPSAQPCNAFNILNGYRDETGLAVERYAPLVKAIAGRIAARLPSGVELDDLIQNGMIALMDALVRYREDQGAQFETYAARRIEGGIIDGLRDLDWAPRRTRKGSRAIEGAICRLEQRLGRPPMEQEIAGELEMPLAAYQAMLGEIKNHRVVYMEDLAHEDGDDFLDHHLPSSGDDPLAWLEDIDTRKQIVEAIERLPEREQTVLSLYYEHDLGMKEIGAVLSVTESRVCQLHSQAVSRIRARLHGPMDASRKCKMKF